MSSDYPIRYKGRKKRRYKLPLPKHGWRGGGERSVDEGPFRKPSRRQRRRHPQYSPDSRPN